LAGPEDMADQSNQDRKSTNGELNPHLKRWITAVILAPFLIYIIGFAPRYIFYIAITAVSLLALNEFHQITSLQNHRFLYWTNALLSILLLVSTYLRAIYFVPVIIVLWAFLPMSIAVIRASSPCQEITYEIAASVLALIYTSLPFSMLITIDRHSEGNIWILFLLCIVIASDTGAFYAGRFFGRHKLHKTVSPNKTWEGTIGGLVSSLIACLFCLTFFVPYRMHTTLLVLALAISVAEQMGDLAESLLKRNSGVKDSGNLLPGHGGILDRIDGFIFAIPVLYVFMFFA